MAINKKNLLNIFYAFLIAHIIIWTFIPSLTNKNLPLDTIEALAWGSNLDWGFDKHPPMSAFIAEFFYKVFGSQDWAYYLLSQIFVITTFYIVFLISNEILRNKNLSIFSVLSLVGIYFYNFTTPEFNVNICQLPFWALTVLYSWKIYNNKKLNLKDSILLGVFAVAGFLSKYLFIYLLISIFFLFAYLILIKKDRKFDFKYLISIEVFLILLVPHIIWLFQNDFKTILYAFDRTGINQSGALDHFKFPILFLLKQVGILIPFILLVFLLIQKFKYKFNFKDKKLIFLIFINLMPLLLIFLTSLISGSKIRTMWMTPFYLFMGTFIIYVLQKQINFLKVKKFLVLFIAIFLLSPLAYAYISLSKDNKRTDYPGKEISQKVQKKWDNDFTGEINVVLGDEWVAGNLSYHLKSRPIWEGKIDKNKLNAYNKFLCIDNICVGNK
tara:strand:+ start:407 stop:1729 length:1323 start_codon:yes stop_codon:yes gene_type:complete